MNHYSLLLSWGKHNEYGKISGCKEIKSDCKIWDGTCQINNKQFRTTNINVPSNTVDMGLKQTKV